MHRVEDSPRLVLSASSYVMHSARVVWSELGGLLLATLVALVIAAPWLAAVSLRVEAFAPLACAIFGAPAWAGLVTVAHSAALGDGVAIGGMPRAIAHQYRRVFALGTVTAGFAWAFERAVVGAGSGGAVMVPLLAVVGAATLIVVATDLYAFPLLAIQDQPLHGTVRTALGLAVASPGPTIGLLAAGTLACLALAELGPGTLLLSLPTLAVLHVNNTLLQLERHHPDTQPDREEARPWP